VIRLRDRVPPDRLIVAESGIRDARDVARLRAAGIDAMLIGETLMRAADPAAALRALYET
jgi:indole-3-glycerol phosphate synthase